MTSAQPNTTHLSDVVGHFVSRSDELSPVSHDQCADLPPFAAYNLVVSYETAREAREALLALERNRVEGSHISYFAIDAEQRSLDRQTSEHDRRQGRFVWGGVIPWALTGAVGAAAIAAMIALLVGASGASIGGAAAGAAVFGLVLAGLWGAFARMGASDSWNKSFDSVADGVVLVGVHTDDLEELARARKAVPSRARFFDRAGRPITMRIHE